MRSRARGKLFGLSVLLIVVVLGVGGAVYTSELRDVLMGLVELGGMRPEAVDAAVERAWLMLFVVGVVATIGAAVLAVLGDAVMRRRLLEIVREVRRPDAVPQWPSSQRLRGGGELGREVAALTADHRRFQTVLEGMDEGVLALDGEERVRLANPAALEVLGILRPPKGKRLLEVARIPALHDLAQRGREAPAEAEFVVPGAARRRVLAHARPLAEMAGTVISMHDVTERRRLETMRRDFVANVSHELRTPVSIIRANAETLLDGALEDPDGARRFTEPILRNAERLDDLIADLLDLARIEAGRVNVELQPVPAREAIDRVVEMIKPMATDRGHRLSTGVLEEPVVLADPKLLDQVLLNLTDNAIKYTPDGGHIRLRARPEDDGQSVRFEVVDDGPGIDPTHRGRLFERFYRVDPGRSRGMGGTGLGLSIVKHLVDAMGGSVGVEPAYPWGSIFAVTLPSASQDRASKGAETEEFR